MEILTNLAKQSWWLERITEKVGCVDTSRRGRGVYIFQRIPCYIRDLVLHHYPGQWVGCALLGRGGTLRVFYLHYRDGSSISETCHCLDGKK
jgi:hypothetical protein